MGQGRMQYAPTRGNGMYEDRIRCWEVQPAGGTQALVFFSPLTKVTLAEQLDSASVGRLTLHSDLSAQVRKQ